MSRRIALITTLLVLALAAPAAAQQNPFGPLPDAPTAEPTPVATASTNSDDNNNTGRLTLFVIGGALVIGFAVMGWFIMRDARRSIPDDELAAMGRLREQGPHAHKQHAKAKARQKGRQQRQARKANRPR